MEQMTNEMVVIENGANMYDEIIEVTNGQDYMMDDYVDGTQETEEKDSKIGLLVGGLLVAGAIAGTAMIMKHPKVRAFRRDQAVKRAVKMNEDMGLGLEYDEIVNILNFKFDMPTGTENFETEVENEETVLED